MGAGSMAGAIQNLKTNRALLKKRKFKNLRKQLQESSGKIDLKLKKVTPQELFCIKQKIRKRHRRDSRIETEIYMISRALRLGFCTSILFCNQLNF